MTNDEITARDLMWTRTTVLILAIVGAAGLVLLGFASPGKFVEVLGMGAILAGASFAVGGLLGFLFGIPRGPQASEASFRHNTNLEQISDWLTKILVGVSLTQVGPIWDGIKNSAAAVEKAAGLSQPAALGIMALYAIAGFLAGYLFTALFLGGALTRAAQAAEGISAKDRKPLEAASIQLSQRGGIVPMSAAAAQSAEKVREVKLDELKSAEDLLVWARAQLAGGNFHEAAEAYQRALRQKPDDPQLRREYAVALAAAKEHAGALLELQKARERVTSKAERENILLDLMFNALYLDPPAGFQRALALGDEYLREVGEATDARFWVYRACALGQWFKWEKTRTAQGPESAELLNRLRAEALTAVEEALRLDASWKDTLRSLLEGNDPDENDLDGFKDDPEFRRLLT